MGITSLIGFVPDQVLTGSADGTIRSWRLDNGYADLVFRRHGGSVCSLCELTCEGRNRILFTGSGDKFVRRWDVAGREQMFALRMDPYEPKQIQFCPDENKLLVWAVPLRKTGGITEKESEVQPVLKTFRFKQK